MAKTIDHLTLMVGVTAYEHEGCQYDALLINVAYKKGHGFCVSWQPVKQTDYGYQTGPMPSSDPLVGGGAVVAMEATKNSVKTLEQMHTNLLAAQEGIRAYFDARVLDILDIFLKSVAKCGYTYDFEKQVKAFINKQDNTIMATNEIKYRPATMAEIEGRDVNLYMNGEQVWVMLVQRSETVGEGEAKVDYIMLTNTKKVQVEDLQVIDDAPEESPMMKQFRELKAKHPNAMLLFRCGDFYETYEDDAAEAAKVLGITLTKSTSTGVRMAGFPHHALDTYLPRLIRAGKRVAICDQLEDPKLTKKLVKRGITELVSPATNNDNNNNQTSEDKTMATVEMNNESKNVQNAQVNNNAAAIVDVNVGEVKVDDIMPVMQPAESEELRVKSEESAPTKQEVAEAISKAANEGKATTMPLGDHGTLVIGGCGFTPKTTKSGKPSDRFDLEKDKPKVTLKRKTPQTSSLPRVTLVVYTTKRGEQAPRIEGFGGESDPRWKRHYDDKVRLAQQKKEADKFNEKLQAQMKGKSKDEREKLRKQWKSVGSDPFGASYFTDRTTGDKYYQMTMGAKYMEVARELVDAYNSGDEQAIAAAEQAVIDCKNGIVKDIEAQRDARKAEREAKRSLSPDPSPKGKGSGYSDQDVAEMLRKVMAGGDVPENIKKLLMKAA